MPTLLEKIQADAAKRLPLPPNRRPDQELARYKTYLKVESHRLKILHRAGGGGLDICRARAAVLDLLQQYLLDAIRLNNPMPPGTPPMKFALVAIGGYGRGELNPHSDIDIMILHDGDPIGTARGKPHPFLAVLMNPGGLLYTLYDIGLKVGHSVRTIDDCVRVANSDMQSKTSLIEARLISGDEPLFKRMQNMVLAKCVMGFEDAYVVSRLEDQATRRTKYGDSACMQEPNIKNGCGGLRDYQNLIWMTFFKYRTRSLNELQQRDLISESEVRELGAAYDFLLRVRNDLHYQVGRPVDVLAKAVQPTIATNLGYTDRSPSRRIEKFMRDFYVHSRNIDLITRTVEQRLALVPEPKGLPSFRDFLRKRRLKAAEQLVDGFRIVNGVISPATPRVFRDQPRRMMRLFLHIQQRGLKLHPDLVQMIRNQLSLVNSDFIRDSHVHETFLEILNQRGNVAPILRMMHEVDFLGKYMPEFGKLTCLVQHEFYHVYAADEHTLMCLQKLDDIWQSHPPALGGYKDVFQKIERPFVLYLALLLHDAGKAGETDDHSEVSSRLAARVAKRLNLDGATTHTLRIIIENHLLMVQISQRRDLDDPSVIRNFAAIVQSSDNLNLLTLHTYADSLGTSAKLWNSFKDSLLWTLHRKAMDLLIGGTEFIRAEAKQRELLAQEVRRLMPPSFSEDELNAHFAHLPTRYYQIHTAREVLTDLTQAHRFIYYQLAEEDKALEPVITWHNEPDRAHTTVKICTWDRAGLFSKIAGAFTAAGINILGAQIFTRTDGIILDTFYVTDTKTGAMVNREERDKFEDYLLKSLTGNIDFAALIAKQKNAAPLYQAIGGERMPTVIQFDNETSDSRTVIDIETEDRVGLLYTISQALAELKLDIILAKIATEKGAATDSFYVTELGGGKATSPERLQGVEGKLRVAISNLDSPAKPA